MNQQILNGLLLDEDCSLSLDDLTHSCEVQTTWIIELVDEGILEPLGDPQEGWRFSADCLLKARMVNHLQRDLGVNIAGAALVLELMDEVEFLRARLYRPSA